jgi:FG-GAP repeat
MAHIHSLAVGITIGVLTPLAFGAQTTETDRLDVRDNVWEDRLGFTLDVTEQWALVGEPNDKEGASPPGAAHFFRRGPDGWTLTQTVHPLDYAIPRQFGHSVAVDGNRAVVGDRLQSGVAWGRGAVYAYKLTGGTWSQVQKLEPPQEERLVNFGFHVALDGDWLAVFAPGDAELYKYNGAVFLYERNTGGWQRRQKLIPRDPGGQQISLSSMAFKDGVLCTGDVSLRQVFLFERIGTEWKQTAVVTDPTQVNFQDNFGISVAYDRGLLVVGNRVDWNPFQTRSGTALIYQHTGLGSWVFLQELQPSIQTFSALGTDAFGRTVAVHDGRILVGAHAGLDGDGLETGQAYLFEPNPNGSPPWVETNRLESKRKLEFGGIGSAVAISSSFALVGADTFVGATPGVISGTAFVYDLALGSSYCPAEPNSTGLAGSLKVTGSVSAGAGALELSAEGLPVGQLGLFLVSRTEGFVPHPGGSQGNLCLGPAFGRFLGSIASTDSAGTLHYAIDTKRMPLQPPVPLLPGESWSFQAWFHDLDPGPTSNFTNAVTVVFE